MSQNPDLVQAIARQRRAELTAAAERYRLVRPRRRRPATA